MVVAFGTVDEFLAAQTGDVRAQVELLSEIIRGSSDDLAEHIKWNSPSYVFDGEDRITLNARGSGPVRVVLHQGATTPEDKGAAPEFDGDPTGLLTWHSNIRASLSVSSVDEITTHRDAIDRILRAWLAQGN